MKIINSFVLTAIIVLSATVSLFSQSDSLHNIGHASMKIKSSGGTVIYIDPFQPGDYSEPADIILVTHGHQDHNQVSLVNQKFNCTVITHAESNINGELQSFTINDIRIQAVPAYNENHNRNQCVGYIIDLNGVRIYHAGDTGLIPEMADLADSSINYALLPVDSIYTMDPAEATEAAEMIQADFSIPMHTEPPPDDYNEDKVSRFTPANRLLVRHGETTALQNPGTSVNREDKYPSEFRLQQSYPNPFNPRTTITFFLPEASYVTLKIYDTNGREVAALISEQMAAGSYSKDWNAADAPSGIYFYRITAGSFSDVRKLVFLK